jgi:hypothetical protein
MPSGIPPWIRLKHALKLLKRVCGFRCVDLRELKPADEPKGKTESRTLKNAS